MGYYMSKLLKKCIFGIFIGIKINQEILFINDVRKVLSEIRLYSDQYFSECESILEEIYLLAIDKKFSDDFIYE